MLELNWTIFTISPNFYFDLGMIANGVQTVEVKFSDASFTASTAVKVNKSGKFTVIDAKSGKIDVLIL